VRDAGSSENSWRSCLRPPQISYSIQGVAHIGRRLWTVLWAQHNLDARRYTIKLATFPKATFVYGLLPVNSPFSAFAATWTTTRMLRSILSLAPRLGVPLPRAAPAYRAYRAGAAAPPAGAAWHFSFLTGLDTGTSRLFALCKNSALPPVHPAKAFLLAHLGANARLRAAYLRLPRRHCASGYGLKR